MTYARQCDYTRPMKLKLTNPQIDAMLEDQDAANDTGNEYGRLVGLCQNLMKDVSDALAARDNATAERARALDDLSCARTRIQEMDAANARLISTNTELRAEAATSIRNREASFRHANENLTTATLNREAERDAALSRCRELEAANTSLTTTNTNLSTRIAQLEDANAALQTSNTNLASDNTRLRDAKPLRDRHTHDDLGAAPRALPLESTAPPSFMSTPSGDRFAISFRRPDTLGYIQKARRALTNAERVILESTPATPTFKVGDSVSFNGSFAAYSVFEVRDDGCYTIISDRGAKRIVDGGALLPHPGHGQAGRGGFSVGTEVTLEDALPDAKIRNAQRESMAAYLRAMADMVVDGNGAGALRTTLRRWASVLRGETSSQTIDSTGGSCDHCGITWKLSKD